ncbi:hypothetical protein [Streptomyces sp. NPDC001401]|uniref:hypothetical protein n=1 Tax=Streptomyces sp. NPDC001401 TaxID=3364570 RepID=UPI0036D04EE6
MGNHLLRRAVVALLAASSLVATATGLASAAQPLASAGSRTIHASETVRTPSSPESFAAQAKDLGLDADQARALQNRVAAFIAKQGGEQLGANKIRLVAGATLVLALPNQKSAGAGEQAPSAPRSALYACRYGHFCAYSGTEYTGDVIDMYKCAEYSIPWSGTGSWINNQTKGTFAQFRDSAHLNRWHDAGAYSSDNFADWSWVWYVQNC